MSILSKAKSIAKKVVNALVGNAGTPINTVKQNQTKVTQTPTGTKVGNSFYASDGKSSSAYPSTPAKTGNNTALTPGQFSGDSSPAQTNANAKAVVPTAPKKTGGGGSSNTLSKATAPSSADGVNSGVGTMNLSGGSSFSSGAGAGNIMGVAGTANAQGALAGLATQNDQEIKTAKELEAQQAQLNLDKGLEGKQSWLKDMFDERKDEPTIAEQRADLEKQYGIQSKISEINSLQDNLNKVLVSRDNQISATNDVLGSMNFINNQVQQISRNSAPEINRLSADINFKTGILTQNQQLVEQAIQDATAESKQRWEDKKFFYNEYYDDVISRLDKKYDLALQSSIKEEERNYDYNVKLHEWKRDVIMEYGLSNSINDSEEVITKAAARAQAVKNAKANAGGKSAGTLEERQASAVSGLQTLLSSGQPLKDGTPAVDGNGFITPAAWRALIAQAPSEGLTREKFIEQFGYLLYNDAKNGIPSSYGLTARELKLITG